MRRYLPPVVQGVGRGCRAGRRAGTIQGEYEREQSMNDDVQPSPEPRHPAEAAPPRMYRVRLGDRLAGTVFGVSEDDALRAARVWASIVGSEGELSVTLAN